ncbi:MAG: 2-oxo acid dehydrogenase subunit E2, partial [Verrucomicrobiota bacterium]
MELKVPEVGESITEVEIGDWLKKEGDTVAKDENVVMIESEKATVELSAPDAGKISKILKRKGEVAKVGEVIGLVESNGQAPVENKKSGDEKPKAKAPVEKTALAKTEAKPAAKTPEKEIKSGDIGGRLRKESSAPEKTSPEVFTAKVQKEKPISTEPGREEEAVPMTLLRRTVAKHLVEAQQTMAMLTTFNEIDLSAVIALRKEFTEKFLAKHGVKPGFMSFFVKATIEALKLVPQVNAEIRGNNIVYHNYFDIGVAIGGG